MLFNNSVLSVSYALISLVSSILLPFVSSTLVIICRNDIYIGHVWTSRNVGITRGGCQCMHSRFIF
jgi:hypothetical protein